MYLLSPDFNVFLKTTGLFPGRKQTNQSYVFINQSNKTWSEAQRYCRENYTDLVSVRNQTENDLIHNMFRSGTFVWIGLYKDNWQWSDQRNSSFRYWAPGKPDNFDGNEKWLPNELCFFNLYFLCPLTFVHVLINISV
uniref:C-type lectin domain-containing protein n=1 Tax=Scleropages formosus TaxID=113540 RepID=A0A8C9SPZ3_SCLFO